MNNPIPYHVRIPVVLPIVLIVLQAILVPLARVWLACRKLARRADPPGATVAILCLKHLGETCAPADWPRRMPCRKLRPRAPVQGAAGVVTARTLFVKGIKYG